VFLEPQGGKWISGLLGVICLLTLVYTGAAYAWGNDGHNIVAYIAADNLDPAARRSVAKLLGTPYQKEAVARAMAAASILLDNQFRARDPSTMSWHFINLCRQDHRTDIAARCDGDCVVAKINEYAARLRTQNYDKWGGNGDLAFLIHFVGDINQPLHAATNDDMGANCVKIRPASDITNLHILWDVDHYGTSIWSPGWKTSLIPGIHEKPRAPWRPSIGNTVAGLYGTNTRRLMSPGIQRNSRAGKSMTHFRSS